MLCASACHLPQRAKLYGTLIFTVTATYIWGIKMNLKQELAFTNARRYVLTQPWLQSLIDTYPEADWSIYLYPQKIIRGNINLGYVTEQEYGLPFRDWANSIDNDSWVFNKPIFKRNVGDIHIELWISGYVKYTPDEWDLLVKLGKVKYSTPQPSAHVYCEY
jgi:hypothetical protein